MPDTTKRDEVNSSRPPLWVLILEDSPRDAKLTASVLENGGYTMQSEVTDSAEFFRESLEQAEYDVILADFNLRNWTALDALEILKRSGKDIPLIVVTGTLGDEGAAECIKQGAADFVLKDRPARLPAAVQRALEEKRLRAENQRSFETISRLAAIVDSTDDAIISVTRDAIIVTCNPGAERMYGFTAEEIKGKPFSIFIPEGRRDVVAVMQERLFRGGAYVNFEHEHLRKDGSRFPVALTLSPIKDAGGVVTGISVIARDITERKRAEAVLRESEEKYRSLVSNIPDVVWTLDAKLRSAFISKNIERVSGFSVDEIYQQGINHFLASLHPDDVPKVAEGLRALFAEGRPFDVEVRAKRKDGGEWR